MTNPQQNYITPQVYVSDNFIKQSSICFFNYLDVFECNMSTATSLAQFFEKQELNGYSFIFYGTIGDEKQLHNVHQFIQERSMAVCFVPLNRFRLPHTHLIHHIECMLELQINRNESFVIGSNGGQQRKKDYDRAFAFNSGMTYISLNSILGLPMQPWSWRVGFPSTVSRATLIKLNNAQERTNISQALQKSNKIIITGPPSSGKHFLGNQLMVLHKAGKVKAEVIVDDGIDWPSFIEDLDSQSKVCVLDIQMNFALSKCLDAMKMECTYDNHCKYKSDRDYVNWSKRHEQLLMNNDKIEIIPFVNKLELSEKKEFWYHY